MDALKQRLQKLAARKTWPECSEENGEEYFCVNDYAGGNIDDAYECGGEDGEIRLAREILEALK